MDITRKNIDDLLDTGRIEVAMTHGRWWQIRRNGKTIKWVSDERRIKVPFKAGLKVYGSITESDFDPTTGILDKSQYRVKVI